MNPEEKIVRNELMTNKKKTMFTINYVTITIKITSKKVTLFPNTNFYGVKISFHNRNG